MKRRELMRKRPSFATVISLISLFVATAMGTAYATVGSNSVGSKELKSDAVKGRHIDEDKIKGRHIKENKIKGKHLATRTLAGRHTKLGKIKGRHIKDGTIDATEIDTSTLGDLVRIAGAVSDDVPEQTGSFNVLTTVITAPSDGFLDMVAGIDLSDYSQGDPVLCDLRIRGLGRVAGSARSLSLDPQGNPEEDCSTSSIIPVTAGTHTVDLRLESVDASVDLGQASLRALFVPFGSDGSQP